MKGQQQVSDSDFRWDSIMTIAKRVGLTIYPELCVYLEANSWSPELGYPIIRDLLARTRDFTAIFCFNDIAAIGAIRAIADAGLRCPEDISVIGFDDISSAAYQTPRLTTVRQPLPPHGRSSGPNPPQAHRSPHQPLPRSHPLRARANGPRIDHHRPRRPKARQHQRAPPLNSLPHNNHAINAPRQGPSSCPRFCLLLPAAPSAIITQRAVHLDPDAEISHATHLQALRRHHSLCSPPHPAHRQRRHHAASARGLGQSSEPTSSTLSRCSSPSIRPRPSSKTRRPVSAASSTPPNPPISIPTTSLSLNSIPSFGPSGS